MRNRLGFPEATPVEEEEAVMPFILSVEVETLEALVLRCEGGVEVGFESEEAEPVAVEEGDVMIVEAVDGVESFLTSRPFWSAGFSNFDSSALEAAIFNASSDRELAGFAVGAAIEDGVVAADVDFAAPNPNAPLVELNPVAGLAVAAPNPPREEVGLAVVGVGALISGVETPGTAPGGGPRSSAIAFEAFFISSSLLDD
jgi:hypothetical protein